MDIYRLHCTDHIDTLCGQNTQVLEDRTGAADLPPGLKVLNDVNCQF